MKPGFKNKYVRFMTKGSMYAPRFWVDQEVESVRSQIESIELRLSALETEQRDSSQ